MTNYRYIRNHSFQMNSAHSVYNIAYRRYPIRLCVKQFCDVLKVIVEKCKIFTILFFEFSANNQPHSIDSTVILSIGHSCTKLNIFKSPIMTINMNK